MPLPRYTPFPSPHRLGTDICSIPRILSLLRGRHGHTFIRRLLRVEEREQSGVAKVLFEWRKARERREGWVEGRREESVAELYRMEERGRGFVRFGRGCEEGEMRRLGGDGKWKQKGEGGEDRFGRGREGGVLDRVLGLGSEVGFTSRSWSAGEAVDGVKREGGYVNAVGDEGLARKPGEIGQGVIESTNTESGTTIPENLVSTRQTSDSPADEEGVLGRIHKVYEEGAGESEGTASMSRPASELSKEEKEIGVQRRRSESMQEEIVDEKKSLADLDKEMGIADLALQKAAQFLAGRFAAKEATMKAHTSRRLTYHSILILKPDARPNTEGSLAPVAIVMDEGVRGNGLSVESSGDRGGVEGEGERGGKGDEGVEVGGGKVVGKEVRISISHDGDYATAAAASIDRLGVRYPRGTWEAEKDERLTRDERRE
ncbi:hypothetical protein BKA65DRAFT_543546 [Rhexocercosporidium sp. MPI-PUGE-AT-0058]|nr:hypothetical protein BKA65DRAFT_543546 [Rhexocercosporidium sp. MPI-PUGE-AT-0058]